jgi:hypothetical protein
MRVFADEAELAGALAEAGLRGELPLCGRALPGADAGRALGGVMLFALRARRSAVEAPEVRSLAALSL